LNRIEQFSQAIPAKLALNLTATEPMTHFPQCQIDTPFLLGPDEESRQWVEAIALHYQMDFAVANKERYGDREVKVCLPEADYYRRNIVLVDDVASSGQTLIQAARNLNGINLHQSLY